MRERKADYPYSYLIVPNETITLRSIFDFPSDVTDLFAFLRGCEVNNCTAVFANEQIVVNPHADLEEKTLTNMKLTIYLTITENGSLVKDYVRYMTDCLQCNPDAFTQRTPQFI